MSARSGMANLVQRVRDLTFAGTAEYTLGTVTYWSDTQIQSLLDAHRRETTYEPLQAVSTQAVGSATYTLYLVGAQNIESGTAVFAIQDGAGSAIGTASYSADYALGQVTFTSNQAGSSRYISYRNYDVYAASADLLTQWAAREARAFDYSGDGQSLKRSQKFTQLKEMADEYRAKAWVVTVGVHRSDLGDGGW
jgi:hypothetical protein